MVNISDKENTYSFLGSLCQRSRSQTTSLGFFYILFSNATLCCDNCNTFLQRTFKLGQNVCLGKILVKFQYGSSGVCLSICLSTLSLCCDNWNTFLQRTFKLRQNVSLDKILVNLEYCSSGVCLSVCPSVWPHFLCPVITGILAAQRKCGRTDRRTDPSWPIFELDLTQKKHSDQVWKFYVEKYSSYCSTKESVDGQADGQTRDPRWPIFELDQDLYQTNILTKFESSL